MYASAAKKVHLVSLYDPPWPLILDLETFSAMATHLTITHIIQISAKWKDITSRGIGVNGRTHRRTAERTTRKHEPLAAYCWRRRLQSTICILSMQWAKLLNVNRQQRSVQQATRRYCHARTTVTICSCSAV